MPLTDEQYHQMANTVFGTCISPAAYADKYFGHVWTDLDSSRMANMENIFRCEECFEWMECDHRDCGEPDSCDRCVFVGEDDGP